MIQVLDVLGKDYKDIKESVIRTDFDEETLKSFSNEGIIAPLSEANLNDDLYFYDFKVEKHKITFVEDKVFEMICMLSEIDTFNLIKKLINDDSLTFRFYPREQLENTKWTNIDNDTEVGFTEWKVKRFEFNNSLVFDIENLEKYGLITFYSEEFNIRIENFFTENRTHYIFKLEKNINKIFKDNLFNN